MSDKKMKTASGYQKKLKLMKKAVDASNKDKKTPFEGKRILRLTDLPGEKAGGMQEKPIKAVAGILTGPVTYKMAKKKKMKSKDIAPMFGAAGLAYSKMSTGGESKGYGAARKKGEGLQDESLAPGKSMDYIKDLL